MRIKMIFRYSTNILNIWIFCSRVLRSSPCTYYLYLFSICPTQFLRGFYIDWTHGKIGCKVHFYVLYIISFQANLIIALTSFEKYNTNNQNSYCQWYSSICDLYVTYVIYLLLGQNFT